MATAAAGLPHLAWHQLRHIAASRLLATLRDPEYVARLLGHSSSAITLGVYGHVLNREAQAERAREALDGLLG
jgi:integrase